MYDEGGKIDRTYYSLTLPFSVQNSSFVVGKGMNTDLFPIQIPNKNLILSSAEGVDSFLYDQYKICFNKMLLGDPDYFVADLDCNFSLHPFMDGKPFTPLISQAQVDDAFATNPYKANREYMNIFDQDGGQDVFVKRSVITKYSQTYLPIFQAEEGKTYIIAYDPATKIDNSFVAVGELFEDEEKGLMIKFVYARNLIESLPDGTKAVIQKPQQLEIIKDLICDFNGSNDDYNGIEYIIFDAGAGGGGVDIGQFLMNEWIGKDKKKHRGLIDKEDPYMSLRIDEYPQNIDKLKLFSFKRDKVLAYERAQSAMNQGLVIFPNGVNIRNELQYEDVDAEGNPSIRLEKVTVEELAPLLEFDIMKEEIIATQKVKKQNNTIQFGLSPDAVSKNMHDDRVDVCCMILNRLMELRAERELVVETKESDFKEFFNKANKGNMNRNNMNPFANTSNPFKDINRINPFTK